MDNNYVLAMYDIRGKQNFIYRSAKLKEIVGGSATIRDCFDDYFYPAAIECRNELLENESIRKEMMKKPAVYNYAAGQYRADIRKHDFHFSEFEERIAGDQYIGEVINDGGGNFYVLFKNEDICKEVTYRFSKKVVEATSTLKVLCSYIVGLQPDNYSNSGTPRGDYQKLYDIHRINEGQEITEETYPTLPIVQADFMTSQPLTHVLDNKDKVSTETYHKLKKFRQEVTKANRDYGVEEKFLDNMVTEKGKESLLACIYIDGNNMGAKIQERIKEKTSYDDCITALRQFSSEIERVYIDDRFREIEERQKRIVIHSGDEITFIVNARDAFDIAVNYLKKLEGDNTSCAGIAIFHSHMPYSDAYRIAEECCESGKKRMREKGMTHSCFIDFHYCQGAIGLDLDTMRVHERLNDCTMPWLVCNKGDEIDDDITTLEDAEKMREKLDIMSRSNVKGLLQAASASEAEFNAEIHRIIAHLSPEKKEQLLENGKLDKDYFEKHRTLVRDLVMVYDLGYAEKEAKA